MLDALFRVFSHALHKGRIRNNVTDVFVNERIPAAIPRQSRKTNVTLYEKKIIHTLTCLPPPEVRTPFSPS